MPLCEDAGQKKEEEKDKKRSSLPHFTTILFVTHPLLIRIAVSVDATDQNKNEVINPLIVNPYRDTSLIGPFKGLRRIYFVT